MNVVPSRGKKECNNNNSNSNGSNSNNDSTHPHIWHYSGINKTKMQNA